MRASQHQSPTSLMLTGRIAVSILYDRDRDRDRYFVFSIVVVAAFLSSQLQCPFFNNNEQNDVSSSSRKREEDCPMSPADPGRGSNSRIFVSPGRLLPYQLQ